MWKQIYDEAWRIERDFFYDPHYHGLDLAKAKKKYEPYLDGIASRDELTYLFQECLGELTVGHMFVGGGERPETEEGERRAARRGLQPGERPLPHRQSLRRRKLEPGLQAPLTQPGVNVKAGDYILAVNGRELHSSDNIYSFFEETAGKQVVLKVGVESRRQGLARGHRGALSRAKRPCATSPGSRATGARSTSRREAAWPTSTCPTPPAAATPASTATSFPRSGKEAVIIDERFNDGGQLADYIIDYLRRPIMSKVVTREGHDWSSPIGSHLRPEGDDHQRNGRLRRRRPALVLPQGGSWPAGRQADLGRAGGHRRLSRTPRRRRRDRSPCRHLRPQRRVGGGEPRRSRRTTRWISIPRPAARDTTRSSTRPSKS